MTIDTTSWDMRSKGLKKQANRFLFGFTGRLKEEVPKHEMDRILFRFCKECIDEEKFPDTNLPFQLTELLNRYLAQECEKNRMPQMRWAYQIFGDYWNPHDPGCKQNPYHILERAYAHVQCDQQTVDLYFGAQIDRLWWGQHHFPDGCLIGRTEFEEIVHTARKVLAEKPVDPSLAAEFGYYVELYHIYFKWKETGRDGDFYGLCSNAGIEFHRLPVVYIEK